MTETIAIFGGSFNPPGVHHRTIAERLTGSYDRVVVVPCGPRPDKEVTNDVPPVYRAAMVDMTFRRLPGVRVDLLDLEASTFTRTHQLNERYRAQGEVWNVVSTELITGGANGQAPIQRLWEHGEELWQRCNFVIIKMRGATLDAADLPPSHRVMEIDITGESAAIRDRVFHHRAFEELLQPEVARYVERHRLYRGMRPPHSTRFELEQVRPLIAFDPWNDDAARIAADLGESEQEDPNLIVVIGGDGTMLRAIRQHWRRRVPFYGINVGHVGFLLNSAPPAQYLTQHLVLEQPVQQLPFCYLLVAS